MILAVLTVTEITLQIFMDALTRKREIVNGKIAAKQQIIINADVVARGQCETEEATL